MIANNTINQDFFIMLKWKDITIGMLQEIGELPDDLNPIEKTAHTVAIIKGLPYEEVEKWTLNDLRKIDLSFLEQEPKHRLKWTFKHKGRRFKLVKNAKAMEAHHFIELQELGDSDKIEALHKIIACLSYRVNIFGRKIEDDYQWKVDNFKDLPAPQFYKYSLFFSALYPKLLKTTLTYLKGEVKKAKEMFSDGSDSSTD
jgi:hypothetical protein